MLLLLLLQGNVRKIYPMVWIRRKDRQEKVTSETPFSYRALHALVERTLVDSVRCLTETDRLFSLTSLTYHDDNTADH